MASWTKAGDFAILPVSKQRTESDQESNNFKKDQTSIPNSRRKILIIIIAFGTARFAAFAMMSQLLDSRNEACEAFSKIKTEENWQFGSGSKIAIPIQDIHFWRKRPGVPSVFRFKIFIFDEERPGLPSVELSG